jgi:hypothetical protein
MSDRPLYHEDGTRVCWNYGGKRSVLQTYARLHENKLGEHWLWVAIERISLGEPEAEVMADYGYRREMKGSQ